MDEKPKVHKNFKNYDHHLEIDRWKHIGGQDGGGDGIEMGYLTSEDVKQYCLEY